MVPPSISPSVIKNLGVSFCNVEESDLTLPALSKKKSVSVPVGKKSIKKKPPTKDEADDKQNKKKPRK